jgi:ribosomal protein S18 acetylase RimI-like enzyme
MEAMCDSRLRIAELLPSQVDAAIQLWHDAGLTRPWNDPAEDLRRALEGPASTVLAGLDGGMLVATAMVGHDGHRGWVYYLAVRGDARGRGYGRAMMRACEAWLAARGVPKLNVMVRGDNATAREFYVEIGYRPSDVTVFQRTLP